MATNSIGVPPFNKIEPPGGYLLHSSEYIVKGTNPTGSPDDASDPGDTDNINDGDAADNDTKFDMLTD